MTRTATLSSTGTVGITFGNGGNGGSKNALYFSAGIPGPEWWKTTACSAASRPLLSPGTLTLLGTGFMSLIGYGWRKGKRSA